jgi:hypothetical protein
MEGKVPVTFQLSGTAYSLYTIKYLVTTVEYAGTSK